MIEQAQGGIDIRDDHHLLGVTAAHHENRAIVAGNEQAAGGVQTYSGRRHLSMPSRDFCSGLPESQCIQFRIGFPFDHGVDPVVDRLAARTVPIQTLVHLPLDGLPPYALVTKRVEVVAPEHGKILGGVAASEPEACMDQEPAKILLHCRTELTIENDGSAAFGIEKGVGIFIRDGGLQRPAPVSDDRRAKIPQSLRVGTLPGGARVGIVAEIGIFAGLLYPRQIDAAKMHPRSGGGRAEYVQGFLAPIHGGPGRSDRPGSPWKQLLEDLLDLFPQIRLNGQPAEQGAVQQPEQAAHGIGTALPRHGEGGVPQQIQELLVELAADLGEAHPAQLRLGRGNEQLQLLHGLLEQLIGQASHGLHVDLPVGTGI